MADNAPQPLPVVHRFIDEVGDTTFYGKGGGKQIILGQEGASLVFGMGIVKLRRPLAEIRSEIVALQKQVEGDPLLNTITSVKEFALWWTSMTPKNTAATRTITTTNATH